jgi:hypothetical protein
MVFSFLRILGELVGVKEVISKFKDTILTTIHASLDMKLVNLMSRKMSLNFYLEGKSTVLRFGKTVIEKLLLYKYA